MADASLYDMEGGMLPCPNIRICDGDPGTRDEHDPHLFLLGDCDCPLCGVVADELAGGTR